MRNVLFVCLGNICRSPAADGVMKKMVEEAKLTDSIFVDSCGTAAHHEGEKADLRMSVHAEKRGYSLDSLARGFHKATDFDKFDTIIAMDNQNYLDLQSWTRSDAQAGKLYKFVSFCKSTSAVEVVDPYYGGPKDFELALDLIEDGCRNLLIDIQESITKAKLGSAQPPPSK